ncbi:unnamed protein product [Chrysoparadoxa australica]
MSLMCGGAAGLVESSVCHPLDTIKTRMQLRASAGSVRGPIMTAQRIITHEGFFSLYKGLTAVMAGIVPKMGVRFTSFDAYKKFLGCSDGVNKGLVFLAGISSGVTEAILVVTPAEVCKIRMQAQYHSMLDPEMMAKRKYKNVLQTGFLIAKEEGVAALYKGIVPTVLRQGCNQGVNFTCYQMGKSWLQNWTGKAELDPWQHMALGGLSGGAGRYPLNTSSCSLNPDSSSSSLFLSALLFSSSLHLLLGMGPLANNPLDVAKTRLQRQIIVPGSSPKYNGLIQTITTIAEEEGIRALWKGITPRLMRIMPGQAITFMVYEFTTAKLEKFWKIPEVATASVSQTA